MKVRVRKIVYHVHMDQIDDDDNLLNEIATKEPLTLYGHQLEDLAGQVASLVARLEADSAVAENGATVLNP